jgi:hypothetical protein
LYDPFDFNGVIELKILETRKLRKHFVKHWYLLIFLKIYLYFFQHCSLLLTLLVSDISDEFHSCLSILNNIALRQLRRQPYPTRAHSRSPQFRHGCSDRAVCSDTSSLDGRHEVQSGGILSVGDSAEYYSRLVFVTFT